MNSFIAKDVINELKISSKEKKKINTPPCCPIKEYSNLQKNIE